MSSTRCWIRESDYTRGAASAVPSGKFMSILVSIILIVTSVVMVLLILLHRGKGGGLSDLFGGGVSSTLSGSSVVEKNLDRITIFTAIVWIASIIAEGLVLKHNL